MEKHGMIGAMKLRTFVLVVAGALIAIGSFAAPAIAHAEYERSAPGDGETVSSPPSEVWAEFSEPPASGSYLQIFDPCGLRVDAGNYSYLAKRMTVSVSGDKAGTYIARWRVASDLDGHPTAGDFSFEVANGAACSDSGSSGNGPKRKSGSDDQAGASATNGGDSNTPGTEAARSAIGGAQEPADGDRGKGKRSKGKRNKHKHHDKNNGGDENEESRSIDLISENPTDPAPPGDLPLDWLLIALFLAGIIGAVGGQIYVYLVDGPRS